MGRAACCTKAIVYQNGKNVAADVIGEDEWEIVLETVSFAEAWAAYEQGKSVRSIYGVWNKKYERDDTRMLRLSEIRGAWVILEAEVD